MKLVIQAENLGQTSQQQSYVNNDNKSIITVSVPNDSAKQIKEQFAILRQNVCENATFLRRIEEEQQDFSILYNEYTKVNAANVQQLSSHNQMELEKEIKR